MALNQATNITPSLAGAFSLGNGVIDATNGMNVSWQVNGQSALVAYQVTIYRNNAASTQLYTTGKVTLSDPFYGKDALGNFVFFSFNISAATLSSHSITNGGNYKLSIRQWWGSTDAESISQSNAAAFITRKTPTISINTIPSPVAARRHTFTATYSQAQGDALNWVRWEIAANGDTANPIYDSQNIYTALLSCTYDGFFSGGSSSANNYAIRCTVQTVNGVEATTGWVTFSVYYTTIQSSGFIRALCDKIADAVHVSWSKITNIPGTASGTYSVSGGMLTLAASATVTWNSVNEDAMSFAAPWTVIWRGTVNATTARYLVTVNHGSTSIRLRYYNGAVRVYFGTTATGTSVNAPAGSLVTAVLTPTKAYIRVEGFQNQLYPSTTLSASATLYPNDGESVSEVSEQNLSYVQGAVSSVVLTGEQVCDFIEIDSGEISAETLFDLMYGSVFTPAYGANTDMLADFQNGLNAGLIGSGGAGIDGYTLYRQRGNERIVRVADVPQSVTELYDYTIRNRRGAYKWSVYARSADSFVTEAVESDEINPCFWDWVLLSCVENDVGCFTVQEAFRFGLNVETGAMSNNNEPAIFRNFTPFPTVMLSPQNYRSGQLSALIGRIDHTGGKAEYNDTITMRDAIFALSTTENRLFLRSRKGDLMEVRITGAVSMQTMDAAACQAQTATIQWTEIADASDVSLIAYAAV